MSLLDFGKVIFGSNVDLIAWMQRKHLLEETVQTAIFQCSGKAEMI